MNEYKPKVGPIKLSVIEHALQGIVEEMMVTIERTSRSTICAVAHDYGSAIMDAKGNLAAVGLGIPIQCAGLNFAVKSTLRYFDYVIKEGDVFIANDPWSYEGCSGHFADVTVLAPVFYEKELVFWVGSRAHQADLGGGRPGLYNPYATDSFMEGLRIPPLKIFDGGEYRKDVFELILANSRTPELVRGDLHSMIGSLRVGQRRLTELIQRHGLHTVLDAVRDSLALSEALTRKRISELPKGTREAERYMDGDLFGGPYKVKARVTANEDYLVIDFTGSDEQSRGFYNSTLPNTYAAVYTAILSTIGRGITPNEGVYRPVKIVAPKGTIVNPDPLSAHMHGTVIPYDHIVHVVWDCIGRFEPKYAIADCTTCPATQITGTDQKGRKFLYLCFYTEGGGGGATWYNDGWSFYGQACTLGGLKQTGEEFLERKYPFITLKFKLRDNSGGSGRYRGGLGSYWHAVFLGSRAEIVTLNDGFKTPIKGVLGGLNAAPTRAHIRRRDGTIVEIKGKDVYVVEHGDEISWYTSGGGGVGDPLEREPELVRRDLMWRFISKDDARNVYGVVFNDEEKFEIDYEETRRLREELKRTRGPK